MNLHLNQESQALQAFLPVAVPNGNGPTGGACCGTTAGPAPASGRAGRCHVCLWETLRRDSANENRTIVKISIPRCAVRGSNIRIRFFHYESYLLSSEGERGRVFRSQQGSNSSLSSMFTQTHSNFQSMHLTMYQRSASNSSRQCGVSR
eukprot:4021997-Pyramimonas_sp.AAC.1